MKTNYVANQVLEQHETHCGLDLDTRVWAQQHHRIQIQLTHRNLRCHVKLPVSTLSVYYWSEDLAA